MAKKSVLAIGLEPALAEPAILRQTSPDLIRSYITSQLERLRKAGYDVESCLIDLGETAEGVVTGVLKAKEFDCVMIGAGLRSPPSPLLLFERIRKNSQSGAYVGARGKDMFQQHAGRYPRGGAALDLTPVLPSLDGTCERRKAAGLWFRRATRQSSASILPRVLAPSVPSRRTKAMGAAIPSRSRARRCQGFHNGHPLRLLEGTERTSCGVCMV